MDDFEQVCNAIKQLEGTEIIAAPLEGILGIPVRSYGRTEEKIKHLQTSNIIYCIILSGCNDNGAFLAHLDKYSFEQDQIPQMLKDLDSTLQRPFDMNLVYNEGKDERQYFIPELKKMILPFQRQLNEKRKKSSQILDLGVDKTGKLYCPGTRVVNEAHDQLEEWFYVRRGEGNAPRGYHREDLACVNDAMSIFIPPEAFTEEQCQRWMDLEATRTEVIGHICKELQLTQEDYVKLALGRPYSVPGKANGALVLI